MSLALRPLAPSRNRTLYGAFGWLRQRAMAIVLCAVLAYLVIPPVVVMIWVSLSKSTGSAAVSLATQPGALTLSSYRSALLGAGAGTLYANTAIFAAGSTAGAVAVGAFLAWVVARTDVPGRSIVYAICFVGFSVPGLLWVLGWVFLLGGHHGVLNQAFQQVFGTTLLNVESMPGLVATETLVWVPMVFLLMVGPMRSMDAALEEGAKVCGAGRWLVFRKVSLPLLWPTVASALLLVFIRALQSFEVPLFIGTPAKISTVASTIYLGLQEQLLPTYGTAAAYGTILLAVLALLLAQYFRYTRSAARFSTLSGRGYRRGKISLGRWRWAVTAGLCFLFVIYLLPLVMMGLEAFTTRLTLAHGHWIANFSFANFHSMFRYPALGSSVLNSLEVAVVTSAAVILLGVATAWLVVRSKLKLRFLADQLIGAPLVLPGVVLSLSLLLFYLYVPIPVYGTIWIIVIGSVAGFMIYGMRYVQPALLQVDKVLEDCAQANGASWLTTFRKITMRLILPAVVGTFLFVFFFSFRELAIPSLIYTGHTEVASTELLDMYTSGNINVLGAYGMLLIAVSSLAAAAGVAIIGGRRWIGASFK